MRYHHACYAHFISKGPGSEDSKYYEEERRPCGNKHLISSRPWFSYAFMLFRIYREPYHPGNG